MWVLFGLFSALFLGLYDVVRKKVLKDNPVIPVLFLASFTGTVLFIVIVLMSLGGWIEEGTIFYVPALGPDVHMKVFLKSVIVAVSWFLAYNALSNLPLTIVVPIRSTGPLWTLVGAILIFSEHFTGMQWIGIITVLGFFYYFTLAGRQEGIFFFRNKWIYAAIAATLTGALSSLYDKYLFAQYDRMFIHAWYSIYMFVTLLPFILFVWYPGRRKFHRFVWSPFIHLIGVLLVVSDFLYFYALSRSGSLIAVLSVIRRSSVILSFVFAAVFFGEQNLKRKGLALLGILIGVILIILGTL